MELRVTPISRLEGTLTPPGDKSISHRAALLGAVAGGTSRIRGYLAARDTLATLTCLRALGVEAERRDGRVAVHGGSLRAPGAPLDCVRSGTTLRLLAGLLAGQPFRSILTGDAQLRARPMERIAHPLRLMGARVETHEGRPPLVIRGGELRGIRYELPIPSAQVKSCLLLAGLGADGPTQVLWSAPSRDHTERMLAAMGARVAFDAHACRLEPGASLEPLELEVVGDISSAAPFLAAAAMLPGSRLVVRRVGVNPTRTGFLSVLERMGARISKLEGGREAGEPWADLEVRGQGLVGIEIGAGEVPSLIDELPLVAVVATAAQGVTRVEGAAELRVKETDRIGVLARELGRLGAPLEERPDGFLLEGPVRLRGAAVSSGGDHRLAMALAVAGLAAQGETVIDDAACVADSYPGFVGDLRRLARA